MKQKLTGILLPVASLPSDCGCGELGKRAYDLVDMLKETGVGIWQILPLNPMGYGNSPYQPYSSYAGDDLYISLEALWEEGLLESRPERFRPLAGRIDYAAVRRYRAPYLHEACRRFQETEDYRQFAAQPWVRDYGVFRTFKKANGERCWNEWRQEQKFWPDRRDLDLSPYEEEIHDHMVLQYLFHDQWMKLKDYAAKSGVRLMGDVPFYVGIDSVDVWTGKENFLLDDEGRPTFIAGVPPDYFSVTGQRWGNPIYDWDYLKANGYRFWIDRISYNSRLFDITRIDHFRAFDTFWKIPSSCPTAVEGDWIEAPGYEALDAVLQTVPRDALVAEDLGELRPEVLVLRDHYGFKGMKIVQFSINSDGKRARDISPDRENMIVYSGTHDNATLREWYEELSPARRRKVRRFLTAHGFKQGSVVRRLIDYTLCRPAEYAILPMMDVLELGEKGKLNSPGTVGPPNWEWKMTDFSVAERNLRRLAERIRRFRVPS